MDDLEFRRQATIKPDSQDPDFLKKMKQNLNNRRFVSDQLEFNQKLVHSLQINIPENLAERIILSQQLSLHKLQRQKQRKWLFSGIAASAAAVAFSLIFILLQTTNSKLLQQQVISHIHQDTHALDVRMDVPKNHIDTMLASYGGKLSGPIGQVSFLGHCIIGDQTGIHMVLNTNEGKVTVILLPSQSIEQAHSLLESQLSGILYPSKKGSIAIVSKHPAAIIQTRERLDRNLTWII